MKFKLDIEKKNSANIGTIEGHNKRLHPTASQLPKVAWITPQGCHEIVPFNADLLEKAKGLAKRKDAVLAVELVVQVGNQTDWRDMPTDEFPEGKRKSGSAQKLNALMAGVKAAAFAEFGKDRIISIDLHTDESTPHAHIVFAPILDGKLQAKHWLNGVASCAILREKLHSHVTKFIECDYTKGVPKGDPHDSEKGAGKSRSERKNDEVLTLKSLLQKASHQIQTLFSQLKSEQKKAQKVKADNDDFAEKAMRKMAALEAENARLRPTLAPTPEKPRQEAKNDALGPLGVVMGDRKSPSSLPTKKPS